MAAMDERVEKLVRGLAALPDLAAPAGVAALLAVQDRLDALVTETVDQLDRSQATAADGAVNTRAWLRTFGGRSDREAVALLCRRARLRALPEVAGAWRSGRLSTAQVDAVVTHMNDRREPLFAEQQADMVAALAPLTARQASVLMDRWTAYADSVTDEAAPADVAGRRLYLSAGFEGGGELSGRLDAVGFETVDTALAAAMTDDSEDEPRRSVAQRRADALIAVARHFLEHSPVLTSGRR